ncbi:substrate import-associated zinc metallohydrolase lipoprotein [Sphingobacterium sp. ML3W]|uniref:substrate import-associated zinc metallohydrolase lipoprotein n=1 Tax=Sphingobacterium sp. ML3W TaxID=1538644 RepID=UPI0006896B3B|nr:substrate import-associated zinc metallohydrolase lipoprotein [Sphingobacterium sp. ML3W]
MKKIFYSIIAVLMILNVVSCTKDEDNLDVDLTKYNSDITANNEIDNWLTTSFVDPYNIEVVYRFERNFTDVNRDISPVYFEKVQPMMDAVLKTFLKTYEEVAGKAFIKKYTPKQFVLYGSPSYNDNGSITLGTADNGRRIVLYELNSLDFTNPDQVKRPIHTIHHEFTHILNQNIVIPPAFEQISKADYTSDWTGAANTAAVAKSLGFITRYSRSSFGEDFAEMTSFLLVDGQIAFENYCSTTNAVAASKLRAKEQLVTSYFKDYYNIDFKILQAAVQKSLADNYNAVDPVDISQSLSNWLINSKVSTIRYTVNAPYLNKYGDPATFKNIVANLQAAFRVNTVNPFPAGVIDYIEFRFTDASNVVVRIGFRTSSTATTNYSADFYFGMNINPTTWEVLFTKSTLNGTFYGTNGDIFNDGFEANLLPYLTNRMFIADWLPSTITPSSPLYRTYGGFYEKGVASNYFYGPVVLK